MVESMIFISEISDDPHHLNNILQKIWKELEQCLIHSNEENAFEIPKEINIATKYLKKIVKNFIKLQHAFGYIIYLPLNKKILGNFQKPFALLLEYLESN